MHSKDTDGKVYVLGDVDRVREHIDRELLASNLESLRSFSSALTRGLAHIARTSEKLMRAETIMAGGDDVLFEVQKAWYSEEMLVRIAEAFRAETGCTISFGIGETVPKAYLNSRRAKAAGGGQICSREVIL